jgi:hypothetical protein
MKRIFTTAALSLLVGIFSFSSAADEHMHGRGMMGGMMGGGMMMDYDSTGMPYNGMMGMGMMGMGMMMHPQIVAVDDGIILLMGNELVKYDKDLNKIKAITLEMDPESMKTMVKQMQQMHSMQKNMMTPPKEEKKK